MVGPLTRSSESKQARTALSAELKIVIHQSNEDVPLCDRLLLLQCRDRAGGDR
jgi:hypothetical protein